MCIRDRLESDDHELAFVCSKYESATDEVNAQIAQIDKIVKKYDDTGMVIGEAPLMKDLEDVTNVDLVRVNAVSYTHLDVYKRQVSGCGSCGKSFGGRRRRHC